MWYRRFIYLVTGILAILYGNLLHDARATWIVLPWLLMCVVWPLKLSALSSDKPAVVTVKRLFVVFSLVHLLAFIVFFVIARHDVLYGNVYYNFAPYDTFDSLMANVSQTGTAVFGDNWLLPHLDFWVSFGAILFLRAFMYDHAPPETSKDASEL